MIKSRLKERESIKRCEDLKLIEDGKAELQRIAKEIEDENNKKTAKVNLLIRLFFYCSILIRNDFVF